jgi:hypothetical protein
VVPDLRGIVEDSAGGPANDFLKTCVFELGSFHQVVEVGDVSLVMLAVVDYERFPGDVRLQGVQSIRQWRELMGQLSIS